MNSFRPKTDVSVIVPVYNGGDKFRKCLTGLASCLPGPKEIIVVVDGATDGSLLIAEAYGVITLINTFPKGPACARNMGARKATRSSMA